MTIRCVAPVAAAVAVAGCGSQMSPSSGTTTHAHLTRRGAQVQRDAGQPRLQRFTIGYSGRGRRIDGFERAAPGAVRALLVFGCIDGDEPAGIAIARQLLTATPPAGSALWIVPDINPTASRPTLA